MIYPWQTALWESVQQARHTKHLPHALLFTGEDGCGNAEFVQTLAKSLLCLEPASNGMACKQCRSCQVFNSQAHPDFVAITLQEDKQAILIDQIRTLNYFLGLSRSYSPCRVAIITPAERMNVNAANGLLKSLEEPAQDTHILLLTSHPAVLLPTIRSRCQTMRMPVPQRDEALAWLQQQMVQHPPEVLLDAARGRPLEALELDSTEMLVQRRQWLQHLLKLAKGEGNITEISIFWEKFDKLLLVDWQLDWLLLLIRTSHLENAGTTLSVELQMFRHLFSSQSLWHIHEQLLELKKLAIHPLNPRLFTESMLILWQAKADNISTNLA
jgi:DNA polymerase-3 subunit delta'